MLPCSSMAEPHECPMCGTTMRLTHTEQVANIPGNPQPTARRIPEWVCPECDYFEEVEKD